MQHSSARRGNREEFQHVRPLTCVIPADRGPSTSIMDVDDADSETRCYGLATSLTTTFPLQY